MHAPRLRSVNRGGVLRASAWEASVVMWLLIVVGIVGLPLLGLLAELALQDTRRTQCVADAALRRAMEPPELPPARSPPVE